MALTVWISYRIWEQSRNRWEAKYIYNVNKQTGKVFIYINISNCSIWIKLSCRGTRAKSQRDSRPCRLHLFCYDHANHFYTKEDVVILLQITDTFLSYIPIFCCTFLFSSEGPGCSEDSLCIRDLVRKPILIFSLIFQVKKDFRWLFYHSLNFKSIKFFPRCQQKRKREKATMQTLHICNK